MALLRPVTVRLNHSLLILHTSLNNITITITITTILPLTLLAPPYLIVITYFYYSRGSVLTLTSSLSFSCYLISHHLTFHMSYMTKIVEHPHPDFSTPVSI